MQSFSPVNQILNPFAANERAQLLSDISFSFKQDLEIETLKVNGLTGKILRIANSNGRIFKSYEKLVKTEFDSEIFLETAIEPTIAYAVAFHEKCLAGLLLSNTWHNEQPAMTMYSLVTDPLFRSQGISSKLISTAVKDFQSICNYKYMIREARIKNGQADRIRKRFYDSILEEVDGIAVDPTQPVKKFLIQL